MSKFFNELTKVKEKYLDNKVRNVLLVEEKSKISYKNFLKEFNKEKIDKNNDKITHRAQSIIVKKSQIPKILSFEPKNNLKTKIDYFNTDWMEKMSLSSSLRNLRFDSKKDSQRLENSKHKTVSNFFKFTSSDLEGTKPFSINDEKSSRNFFRTSISFSKLKTTNRESCEIISKPVIINSKSFSVNFMNKKPSNKFLINSDRKNDTLHKKNNIIYWKSAISSSEFVYNSGKFNLPLVSKTLNII